MRGRDVSDGNDFGDYDTDVRDGYDAVEWAAKLPGANGQGGTDRPLRRRPARVVRRGERAAASRRHRALGGDRRSVAHRAVRRHGVFADQRRVGVPHARAHAAEHRRPRHRRRRSPTCRSSTCRSDSAAATCRCGIVGSRIPTLDAYWRAHAVTTNIAKVRAPVLQISGWYDDSRGPIDYTNALHEGAGPSVHSARDGPRRAQGRRLRGRRVRPAVARRHAPASAPLVRPLPAGQGQRRRHASRPFDDLRVRRQHVAQGSGVADRARGARRSGTCRPAGRANTSARQRRARHDSADRARRPTRSPTTRRIRRRTSSIRASSRRRSTRISRALNATRRDALVFTSKPLTKPIEVTGPMSATLWAATDAKDTDWNVMLLDVFPDGHAERVQDGLARARFRQGFDKEVLLTPGSVERYDIDLWFTSRVFAARPPAAGERLVGAVPEVRPQPEHRRQQRARQHVRRRASAAAARRRASVARRAAGRPEVGVGRASGPGRPRATYGKTADTAGSFAPGSPCGRPGPLALLSQLSNIVRSNALARYDAGSP